ncbi:MAG: hypothetical protein GXO68_00990 [Crenarchaeota archaeon]|nr:hypothetical protein [Thermoproteota archaeon]
MVSLGGLVGFYRGVDSVRLPLLALGVYGLLLSLLTYGGLIGLVGTVFFLLGLTLSYIGRSTAGILAYFIGFMALTLTKANPLVVLGLVATSLAYVYVGTPSIEPGPVFTVTLRSIPFALYGGLFAYLLYLYGSKASYLPRLSKEIFASIGGYSLVVIVTMVFFSLLALWYYLPGSSVPSVEEVAAWLRRNRVAAVEALAYSLVALSSRANILSLFAILIGIVAYVWIRALGYGRNASFLGFMVAYAAMLYLMGIMDDIDAYLATTP